MSGPKFRYYLGVSRLIACILAEETAFEIGHFHTFQTSMTLILTLDQVTWHTVTYHSSTYQVSLKFEKLCGWTDIQKSGQTIDRLDQPNNG